MQASNVEKFFETVARQGYDRGAALKALGVSDIAEFNGNIGQAHNRLQKHRDAQRAGEEMKALVLSPEKRRALYPNDELAQRGAMLRAFAPFAHGKEQVSDQEIALVVLRSDAMNLDALNPHEIEVFKDKRGKINFMLSYVLEHQWMEEFHGGHLHPDYVLFTEEEKGVHGIPFEDKAMWCRFILKRDIAIIKEMMEAGWDAAEARASLTNEGHATVKASDWAGDYFAPNARDRLWKLKKRAYVDAVRSNFGDPSPSAIFQLRRARGEENITAEDWHVAKNETIPGLRVKHARFAVRQRARLESPDDRTPEEVLAYGRKILHGSEADLDGDLTGQPVAEGETITEPSESPEQPEPSPTTRPYSPAALRDRIARSVEARAGFKYPDDKLANFQGAVRSNLEACFAGDKHSRDKRHLVAEYLVGEPSKWNDAQTKALHKWLNAKPDDGGLWTPDAMAVKEAQAVAREAAKAAGQTDMFDPPAEFTRDELDEQWSALWKKALALGLKPEAVTPATTDEELAGRIDGLAPLVTAAEEKEKKNDD